MASLRVGLGQYNLKLGKFCSEDRNGWWAKARIIKLPDGDGSLRRRLKVMAGAAADGLANLAVSKKIVNKEDADSGKVDQWIRDSVELIVKSIEEAPFLLHIYPEDDQESTRSKNTKMVREKASVNNWPNVKQRWEKESYIPNGIALVEELKNEDYDLLPDQHCSSTKVFGIVVQERGFSYPACYMLKTSRVRSISGFCTHFCIFRVDCFGETSDALFKKHWLCKQ